MPNLAVVATTTLLPVVDMASVPTNKTITGEVLKTFTSNGMATSAQLTTVQTLANVALDTKANIADLSTAAFSGDYDDLSNLPDIPAVAVDGGLATVTQLSANVITLNNTIGTLQSNAATQAGQIAAISSVIQFRTIGNSKGSTGDTINTVAIDSTSVYFCTATYTTGVADIWVKTAWATTGTW